MRQLCDVTHMLSEYKGADTSVNWTSAVLNRLFGANIRYSWGEVYGICETIRWAAQESIELNLPVLISW